MSASRPAFLVTSAEDTAALAAVGPVIEVGDDLPVRLASLAAMGPVVWVPPRTRPDAAALDELCTWLAREAPPLSCAIAPRRLRCGAGDVGLPDGVIAVRGSGMRLRRGRLEVQGVAPCRLARAWWVDAPRGLADHLDVIDRESTQVAALRRACRERPRWSELVWPLVRGLPGLARAGNDRRALLTRLLLEGYGDVLAAVKLRELMLLRGVVR